MSDTSTPPAHQSIMLTSSPTIICNASAIRPSGHVCITPRRFDRSKIDPSNATLAHAISAVVHWVSLTPGLPSTAYHLQSTHQALFACNHLVLAATAIESAACAVVNPACLPVIASLCAVADHLDRTITPPMHDTDDPVHLAADFFRNAPFIHGMDATCPSAKHPTQLEWLASLLPTIQRLAAKFGLHCLLVTIPVESHDSPCTDFDNAVTDGLPLWRCCSRITNSACYGDGIATFLWTCLAFRHWPTQHDEDPVIPTLPIDSATPYGDHIRQEYCQPEHALGTLRPAATPRTIAPPDPFTPLPIPTDPNTSPLPTAYDPDFPAPALHPDRPSFSLPFTDSVGWTLIRLATRDELLDLHSVPPRLTDELQLALTTEPTPFSILGACTPFRLAGALADTIADFLFRSLDPRDTNRHDTVSVLLQHATRAANPLDWATAYASDPDTIIIIERLARKLPWDQATLNTVSSTYRPFLRDGRMCLFHGKLIALQPVSNRSQVLSLIVVPASLRRHLFSAYHASPVAGHMKEFKTLHRLRLRFLWPKMRSDISSWVRMCPHCVLTDRHSRESKELVFSWPVTSPFFILHVDLWAPGTLSDYHGNTYILAGMCDLTGFIIQASVDNITSHNLARVFFQEFLLKFGMCGLIIVDAGSTFRATFEAMCSSLHLRLHPAAKANHKAVSVERYFRFLNKAVAIAINDRMDPTVWVPAAMTAGYAWNSAPIDGTDILRSVAAVGRPFLFPIDVSMLPSPQLTSDDAAGITQYLSLVSEHVTFSQTILRYLVEDRRTAHAERSNESRRPVVYATGDRVMANVQVQSSAANDKVAKLSYQRRGPFQVTACLGNGAYELQSLSRPNGAKMKFHSSSLSPLPPGLLPCDPIDTADLRYLNQDSPPVPNPLSSLDIQLYNDVWFDDKPPSHPPPFDFSNPTVPIPSIASGPFPPLAKLYDMPHADSTQLMHPVKIVNHKPTAPTTALTDPMLPVPAHRPNQPTALYESVINSEDRMFFVSYRPEGTLRPRWYLVSVDLECSLRNPTSADCQSSGLYYVHFYCRHPSDRTSSDACARWWPEWHRYTTDPANDSIIFGDQVLFRPDHTPDATRYIAWSDVVPLSDPSVALLGPFDLSPTAPFATGNRRAARQWVPLDIWQLLCSRCAALGICSPSVSPTPVLRSRWTKSKTSSKRK